MSDKCSSESSSEKAHKRLKFVLIHDRANVSPEVMEHIKNDIIKVISNYMEIDKQAMEISLENDADAVAWQHGTSYADVMYEAMVEGAITRMMGIFENLEGVSMIMPIARSISRSVKR